MDAVLTAAEAAECAGRFGGDSQRKLQRRAKNDASLLDSLPGYYYYYYFRKQHVEKTTLGFGVTHTGYRYMETGFKFQKHIFLIFSIFMVTP